MVNPNGCDDDEHSAAPPLTGNNSNKPYDQDKAILFGRGKNLNQHHGNIYFVLFIHQHLHEFDGTRDPKEVADDLVKRLEADGRPFLMDGTKASLPEARKRIIDAKHNANLKIRTLTLGILKAGRPFQERVAARLSNMLKEFNDILQLNIKRTDLTADEINSWSNLDIHQTATSKVVQEYNGANADATKAEKTRKKAVAAGKEIAPDYVYKKLGKEKFKLFEEYQKAAAAAEKAEKERKEAAFAAASSDSPKAAAPKKTAGGTNKKKRTTRCKPLDVATTTTTNNNNSKKQKKAALKAPPPPVPHVFYHAANMPPPVIAAPPVGPRDKLMEEMAASISPVEKELMDISFQADILASEGAAGTVASMPQDDSTGTTTVQTPCIHWKQQNNVKVVTPDVPPPRLVNFGSGPPPPFFLCPTPVKATIALQKDSRTPIGTGEESSVESSLFNNYSSSSSLMCSPFKHSLSHDSLLTLNKSDGVLFYKRSREEEVSGSGSVDSLLDRNWELP